MIAGRLVVLPRPGDDVDAGRAGHPPVDDRDVVVVPAQLVDGVVAALDRVDVVALVLEPEDEHVPQALVVFGDEDAHGGSGRGDEGAAIWADHGPDYRA